MSTARRIGLLLALGLALLLLAVCSAPPEPVRGPLPEVE